MAWLDPGADVARQSLCNDALAVVVFSSAVLAAVRAAFRARKCVARLFGRQDANCVYGVGSRVSWRVNRSFDANLC